MLGKVGFVRSTGIVMEKPGKERGNEVGAKLLLFEVYTACSVGLLDDEIVIFETKKGGG